MVKEKLPPHDMNAEESLIGSILIDGSCFLKIKYMVSVEDFYDERNSVIYEACNSLYSRHIAIDIVTLAQELERSGKLSACGGSAYLSHLISVVPTSIDAEYYAEIVHRLSVHRKIIALGNFIEQSGYKVSDDANTIIDSISNQISSFKKDNVSINDLYTSSHAADEMFEMIEEFKNPAKLIPWGFHNLDDLTSGIFPELTVIGARPSVGKTELMLNIANNIKHHCKILFCSAEMTIRGLLERRVAQELKITIPELRRGNLSEEQLDVIVRLSGEISEEEIYYLPPKATSSQLIYNTVSKLIDSTGVDIVFIDYIQILKDCWKENNDKMNVRVGRAVKVIKGIVNDFNIPVIAGSQLNRLSEYRADPRPKLSDLRETGDIEQDADNVILLHRDKEESPNILECKIAKGRQTGDFPSVRLLWLPDKRKYVDYRNA